MLHLAHCDTFVRWHAIVFDGQLWSCILLDLALNTITWDIPDKENEDCDNFGNIKFSILIKRKKKRTFFIFSHIFSANKMKTMKIWHDNIFFFLSQPNVREKNIFFFSHLPLKILAMKHTLRTILLKGWTVLFIFFLILKEFKVATC